MRGGIQTHTKNDNLGLVVASQEAEPEESEVHGQPRQVSDTCLIHETWAAPIKITLLFKIREGEGKGGGNRDGE